MSSDLEEFAESTRRACVKIMRAVQHSRPEEAGALAAALCTQAAFIVQQGKMAKEVSAPERYDLAALHVQADVASNSETPFEDE